MQMAEYYHSFIVIDTHQSITTHELRFEPILKQGDLLPEEQAIEFMGGFPKELFAPQQVAFGEGREALVLKHLGACCDRIEFVRRTAKLAGLDAEPSKALLNAARALESMQQYIFPERAPIRHGAMSKETAEASLRPDCEKAGTFKTREPGKAFSLQPLAYREARQVLVQVTLTGPALLRITQEARGDGENVRIGSFLLPIFHV